MNGVVRRRGMMASKGIETIDIDRPNYWRIDFSTDEDNKAVMFGDKNSFSLAGSMAKSLILDGAIVRSDGNSTITIPKAGDHTIYMDLNQRDDRRLGILTDTLHPTYVRVPTNRTASPRLYASGELPLIDLLTPSVSLYYNLTIPYRRINILRIPDDVSIDTVHSTWRDIANKIVQVHYNFI